MEPKDLLHKRILIGERTTGYSQKSTVEEIKILEVSPSGKWMKIQNVNGNKYWKNSSDVIPIEILSSLEINPNK